MVLSTYLDGACTGQGHRAGGRVGDGAARGQFPGSQSCPLQLTPVLTICEVHLNSRAGSPPRPLAPGGRFRMKTRAGEGVVSLCSWEAVEVAGD